MILNSDDKLAKLSKNRLLIVKMTICDHIIIIVLTLLSFSFSFIFFLRDADRHTKKHNNRDAMQNNLEMQVDNKCRSLYYYNNQSNSSLIIYDDDYMMMMILRQ